MKLELILLFLSCALLNAQHIGYLMPSGGRAGETLEVIAGGQRNYGMKGGYVTGEGVTVESVTPVPGFPNVWGVQQKYVSTWMRNIQDGKKEKPPMPTDPKVLKEWRKCAYWEILDQLTPLQFHLAAEGLFIRRNPLQMSPSISQMIILRIKIDPKAKPGRRELRLYGNGRVSDPMPFYVDTLPEVREPFFAVPPKKKGIASFTVPAVLNGQIMPGETDRFRFPAKRGEKIYFQAFARVLNPFLGDCVPGHFQCILELRDASGKTLIAQADDRYFNPDPVLACEIPADGEYLLCIRDSIYRGRADFVYRVRVSKEPVPYELGKAPEFPFPTVEAEKIRSEKCIAHPVLVHGVIGKEKEKHCFRVSLKKDEKFAAEVFARRLNSPLDSRLRILDEEGKVLAENDDFPRPLVGIIHHQADSCVYFTAPETGLYQVEISDNCGKGGKDYGYYLRLDQMRPDFRLWCAPSVLPVSNYGDSAFTVYAERLDGFDGEITLSLKVDGNFALSGKAAIPPGACQTIFTLTVQNEKKGIRPKNFYRAKLFGSSGKICHEVIPAQAQMQAFAYTHFVPAEELILCRSYGRSGRSALSFKNLKNHQLRLTAGGKPVTLTLNRNKLPKDDVYKSFQLKDAPAGLVLEKFVSRELKRGKGEIDLVLRAGKETKPGIYNLLVQGSYRFHQKDRKTGKVMERTNEFILPVIQFEITK